MGVSFEPGFQYGESSSPFTPHPSPLKGYGAYFNTENPLTPNKKVQIEPVRHSSSEKGDEDTIRQKKERLKKFNLSGVIIAFLVLSQLQINRYY